MLRQKYIYCRHFHSEYSESTGQIRIRKDTQTISHEFHRIWNFDKMYSYHRSLCSGVCCKEINYTKMDVTKAWSKHLKIDYFML